jgi:N-formylglutamate deformylase
MNELYPLQRGDEPLLISIPHLGSEIPEPLRHLYSDETLDQ